ncbi:MAG: hypothetical protein RLZZ361_806 [Cyanobacteriota bacterium]|jgi:hypothetical protein
MTESNFDSKLQKTITTMQEINYLLGENESEGQASKDKSFAMEAIVSLKQNIMNQTQKSFNSAQEQLDNPPKKLEIVNGLEVQVIDQELMRLIRENFETSQINLDQSKSFYAEAKVDAVLARNQLVEKDQIKNLLESDLDALYSQVSSLLSSVRLEGKSALKNMETYKELFKESRNDDKKSENQDFFNNMNDKNPYFKENLHVIDFEKVLDSGPGKTSHMGLEAVDDN